MLAARCWIGDLPYHRWRDGFDRNSLPFGLRGRLMLRDRFEHCVVQALSAVLDSWGAAVGRQWAARTQGFGAVKDGQRVLSLVHDVDSDFDFELDQVSR